MTRWCVLCAALASAVLHAQDAFTTRTIELTLTEGTSMAASASPDGRWIAIDLLGSIWVLPFRGGDARRVTPDLLEARQPTWSPDSDSIAFQGYDDGVWHIYVISREGGEAKRLTSGEFDDREPDWSHDGQRIAFSSDRGAAGVPTIWQVMVATGEVYQLSAREGWMPCWSSTDSDVTFVSPSELRNPNANVPGLPGPQGSPALYAVDRSGRDRLVMPPPKEGPPFAAACGRVNAPLAYAAPDGLHIGGQPVSKKEDVFPFRPQWVNRVDLLYTADGHIKRRSTIGDAIVDIPFRAQLTLHKSTYAAVHRLLDTTDVQRVNGIASPAVAPNGGSIAFVAVGDVWLLPLGGVPRRVTDDPFVELDPAWAPDGSKLAFASDRGGRMDLWIHDFKTNEDTQLTREGGVSGPAWSPDGAHIAYVLNGREIWVASTRRDEHAFVNPALSTMPEIGRPTWGPDQRVLAAGALFPYSRRFREGLNQLLLHRTEPQGNFSSIIFPERSAGDRERNGPLWAPDGFHIAFTSGGHLWSVPVDANGAATGPALDLTPDVNLGVDVPASPSWTADSRYIFYLTPAGFRRVPADGGPADRIPVQMSWRGTPSPLRVVIHAGHVLDGVFEGLRDTSDIVVENGIISEVTSHRDDLHSGFVVDAAGETVMPGLVDMNARVSREYGSAFGRVWLAYGVTSVRLHGVNPYDGLELRESIESGRRPGPRFFLSGESFEGARVYDPASVSITSNEQLDVALDRATTLGFDFLRTDVRLPSRFQKRIVEYAHERGVPVTSSELYPAVSLGIDGLEHLQGTSRLGYSPKITSGGIAYKDVIDLIAKSGVAFAPTIGIQGAFTARETGDKDLLTDKRLALFPKSLVLTLADLGMMRSDVRDRNAATLRPYETMLKSIVAAGGTIVAGSAAPLVPYGLGLHVELEEYVRSGMTPFQALQSATINPARALGLESELGTIEPGKRADLTFLGGDPLQDIRNTRDVRRVMKGGRIYTLDELLTGEKARQPPAR